MKYAKDAERIKEICEYLHLTSYTLSKNLGYKSPSSIYHIERGLNQITSRMAMKIIDVYPQFNFVYLIGEGSDEDTLIAPEEMARQQQNFSVVSSSDYANTIEQYRDLKKDIGKMHLQLSILRFDMQKMIKLLEKK